MKQRTMHEGELSITTSLVRRLVDDQFPEYRDYPLTETSLGGTMNRIYLLGKDLYVRMPRMAENRDVEKEAACLNFLKPYTTLRIPTPLGVGHPTRDYPAVFGIFEWLPGDIPGVLTAAEESALAKDLARFVKELYALPVPENFPKAGRRPLKELYDQTVSAIDERQPFLEKALGDIPTALADLHALWDQAMTIEPWDGDAHIIHADLLPTNILMQDGKLSAVIDFGSFGAGDPCFDLLPAWAIFSSSGRKVFMDLMDRPLCQWQRARAYALHQAVLIIPYYAETYPEFTDMALNTLRQILTDSAE